MDSTNKLTKVIAIYANGHGAGKSTLARFIHDYVTQCRDKQAVIYSFTENIKEAATELLPWDAVYTHKDEPRAELGGKTPRDLFIFLGEGIKREFNPLFFVDKIIHDINKYGNDLVIIDDLRFPDELHRLREEYGPDLCVVHIEGDVDSYDQDPSTEGLIDEGEADVHITNLGTLGHLYSQAVFIATEVLGIE